MNGQWGFIISKIWPKNFDNWSYKCVKMETFDWSSMQTNCWIDCGNVPLAWWPIWKCWKKHLMNEWTEWTENGVGKIFCNLILFYSRDIKLYILMNDWNFIWDLKKQRIFIIPIDWKHREKSYIEEIKF